MNLMAWDVMEILCITVELACKTHCLTTTSTSGSAMAIAKSSSQRVIQSAIVFIVCIVPPSLEVNRQDLSQNVIMKRCQPRSH